MFGIYAAPLVALFAALAVAEVQAGPIPQSSKVSPISLHSLASVADG
jgi:hypothetical protein